MTFSFVKLATESDLAENTKNKKRVFESLRNPVPFQTSKKAEKTEYQVHTFENDNIVNTTPEKKDYHNQNQNSQFRDVKVSSIN